MFLSVCQDRIFLFVEFAWHHQTFIFKLAASIVVACSAVLVKNELYCFLLVVLYAGAELVTKLILHKLVEIFGWHAKVAIDREVSWENRYIHDGYGLKSLYH
jgi:hypothetical protein